MSDVTGSKEFVAFGDQGQRPPDPQPERALMVAPDGRTVQVMAEDVAGFAERGFEPAAQTEPIAEAAPKPRRTRAAAEEES